MMMVITTPMKKTKQLLLRLLLHVSDKIAPAEGNKGRQPARFTMKKKRNLTKRRMRKMEKNKSIKKMTND